MKREDVIPIMILIVVIIILLVIDGIALFSKVVPVDYWCEQFPNSTVIKTGYWKYIEIDCSEYLNNRSYYISYKEFFDG